MLDQALFIVTSDQGFYYGEFGHARERRLAYEPSTHIPLVMRYPGLIPRGATPAALASNVDLAPMPCAPIGTSTSATVSSRGWTNCTICRKTHSSCATYFPTVRRRACAKT